MFVRKRLCSHSSLGHAANLLGCFDLGERHKPNMFLLMHCSEAIPCTLGWYCYPYYEQIPTDPQVHCKSILLQKHSPSYSV